MQSTASAARYSRREHGRIVAAHAIFEGKPYRLVSVYAPPDSAAATRPDFFKHALGPQLTGNTILGLDANCVPDEALDLKRVANSPYRNDGADELEDICSAHSLIDVAREWLGDLPFFTAHHTVPGGTVTSTRIDRIYAPDADGTAWEHVQIAHDIFGRDPAARELDHEMAVIQLITAKGERGTDLQTMNESIFEDEAFNTKVHAMIEGTVELLNPEANRTWRETWDSIKTQLRSMGIAESMRRRKKDTEHIKSLKRTRDGLKGEIDAGLAAQPKVSRYIELESEINAATKQNRSLYETTEEIAYNRGKSHDNGSAAFFRPWKPRGAAQWITKIFTADWSNPSNPIRDGTSCEDPAKIAEASTPYWSSLFTRKATLPAKAEACLKTLRTGNRVLPPSAAKCGAAVTHQDVSRTCNTLPTGKSPGPDRIPNKFYKTFSAVIAPILANVINESHEKGEFTPGFSDGLIALLYKKKERDDPRNYRPITLLNGDYKIMMRILTQRMNETVVQFVSRFQNGFVPDAFIAENIMLLKLVQAYIEDGDEDAFFVFLDMEKAFDRCSWDFLIKAMKEIGYDDAFIQYVQLVYSHDHPPSRKLYVNGYLGPSFQLGSGVAQGCPISPLLFLLITEPLARLFERDTRLQGVTIGNLRLVISQFADDTTLVCRPGDESPAQDNLDTWMQGTAMLENDTKREGQLLGKLNRERARAPRGVIANEAWVADGETIRALGAPMGNNFDETAWWKGRYRTVKARIATWPGMRRLSIRGRNLLLQSIFYGSFRYWLYFLIMPDPIIKIIELDAKQILWASDPTLLSNEEGTSKRARRWIHEMASYLPWSKGGAGILHWESHCKAFYASWIIRFLDPRRAPWKDVLRHWISDEYIHEAIILSSASDSDRTNEIPDTAPYIKRCLQELPKLVT